MASYKEVISNINQLREVGYKQFCPDCYAGLEETKEGTLYCPNEMCLNEEQYNKKGGLIVK